ncbi:hypothetical protein FRC12_012244 [Ceratobasidium sp. 428]|nr:hypothetical protein FRC12_012244 [Ceratobasidium sp. 428]
MRQAHFASKSLVSRELPLSPDKPTRDEPLIMRFGENSQWGSDTCVFKRWYDNQVTLAQSGPKISFTEIHHHARVDNSTRHEFLIIPLRDNSYYLIERTGGGSRVDAILRGGSEAYDTIRWRPASDHRAWDKESTLKLRLVFSSEPDILNVLAICHSIQQHPQAYRYRLQTYNCYFFCCAVIAILARHHASWESVVSQSWNEQCLGPSLREAISNPPRSYTFLRACEALRPFENSGVHSLTNKICEMGLDQMLGQYKQSPMDAMWWWEIELLKEAPVQGRYESDLQGLFGSLWNSTSTTSEGSRDINGITSTNGMTSRSIFRRGFLNPKAYSCERLIAHILVTSGSTKPTQTIRRKIATALCEPVFGTAAFAVWVACSGTNTRIFRKELKVSSKLIFESLGLGVARRFIQFQIFSDFLRDGPITDAIEESRLREQGLIEDILINIIFDQVRKVMTEAEKVALWRAISVNSSHKCWMYSIRSFIRDALWFTLKQQAINHQLEAMKPRIAVQVLDTDWGLFSRPVDVFALQDHIRKHIKKYAARVNNHGLGATELVLHDVETAISDIWRSYRRIQQIV